MSERQVEAKVSAALGAGGLLLAMVAVYAGTGLQDGFGDWDLHRLGRRFLRWLPALLPLAAGAGVLIGRYHETLLKPSPPSSAMLLGVVRAFVLFPCYGFVALFAFIGALLVTGIEKLVGRTFRGEASGPRLDSWLGLPIWFLALPFVASGVPSEGDLTLPKAVAPRRLWSWLPFVLAIVLLLTRMVSEESGERVDPCWVMAGAAYWLAEYLIVTVQIAPILKERARK